MKYYLFFFILLFSCNNEIKENKILEFQKELISNQTTGSNVVLIHKQGEIVYNEVVNSKNLGDKDIDGNTIFAIHSMSKPITTVAMMILLDRGSYDLNDNLSKYLPEYENVKCKGENEIYQCKNKIKIIDLLTHRSGYTYYNQYGENWLFNMHKGIYPDYINTSRFSNLDDFSNAISKEPLDFEPGTMYTYGLNQAILGRLIEVLTGQSFYDFLKENLFDKLEMYDTKFHLTYEERSRLHPLHVNINANTPFNQSDFNLKGYTAALDGYSYLPKNKAHFGGEGLVSTLNDYSNFCKMLVNKGKYNEEIIISENSFNLMVDKYTNAYPDPNEPFTFPDLEGYYIGFTFSVLENQEVDGTGASKGIFGWSGYHNTHFWIDTEKDIYAIFLSRSIEFDFKILNGLKKAVYSTY